MRWDNSPSLQRPPAWGKDSLVSRKPGRHIPIGFYLCISQALASSSVPTLHTKKGSQRQRLRGDHVTPNVTTAFFFFFFIVFTKFSWQLYQCAIILMDNEAAVTCGILKRRVFSLFVHLFWVSTGLNAASPWVSPTGCQFGYWSRKAKQQRELRHTTGCCLSPANATALPGSISSWIAIPTKQKGGKPELRDLYRLVKL